MIYVAAHIKGPCTWLFPNHYRRTINYEALFDRRLYENGTTNACLCGPGTGGRTKQSGPKQVPIFGKEANTAQIYSLPPLSLFVLTVSPCTEKLQGGDEKTKQNKTGNSTLARKKSQRKQSNV